MKRNPDWFALAGVLGLAIIVFAIIYALRPVGWIVPSLWH